MREPQRPNRFVSHEKNEKWHEAKLSGLLQMRHHIAGLIAVTTVAGSFEFLG